MKFKKHFFYTILLLSLEAAFCQAKLKSNSNELKVFKTNWLYFEKPTYCIQYPKNWEVTESEGFEFIIFQNNNNSYYRNNFKLISLTYGGRITKKGDLPIIKLEKKELTKSANFVKKSRTINNLEYYKTISNTVEKGISLKQICYYYFKNDTKFILIFTIKKEDYASLKYLINHISETFINKN